ncbi:MAG: hypothetical protein AAF688_10300 [Bacteroidota bacterium]
MRNYLFGLLVICGLLMSCKNVNKTQNDPPDPNKKNWYVYKQKNRPTCPDPIWGPDIQNPQNYDLICGPLTKKEADECWKKNCNVANKITLSEWDPNEDFYALHVDNDCDLSANCSRVKIVPSDYSTYNDDCDAYERVKIIDLNKWDVEGKKNCFEEQDISLYKKR